jgi:hypothetical protein
MFIGIEGVSSIGWICMFTSKDPIFVLFFSALYSEDLVFKLINLFFDLEYVFFQND